MFKDVKGVEICGDGMIVISFVDGEKIGNKMDELVVKYFEVVK